VELLEREPELATFDAALDAAARGAGQVLLVSGEAGIGKTTLTREIARRAGDRARVLVGACDDLLTPRTLGPFRDLPLGGDSVLRRALDGGADRDAVFAAVLDELDTPLQPTVAVIEDAHWADEATRDVLAFLGRRLSTRRTVLVVTYRDALDEDHPLRSVLGTMAGPTVHRLPLRPLSTQAVATLAHGAVVDVDRIEELTGGNPFLVTELLAADDPSSVPLTVRDAVAARLQGAGGSVRHVLLLLAVAPAGLELSLLRDVVPSAADDVAAAERLGLVELTGARIRFRHDLLRDAVASTSTTARVTEAHARLLAALERQGDPDPAQAAHHAVGAGDVAAIVRYAPIAAQRAWEVSSHRDAIVLLEAVLPHEDRLPRPQLTTLLRAYAFELYLTNRHLDALASVDRAVRMLEEQDEPEPVAFGKALTLRSHVATWAARPDVARDASARSIEVLADAGDPDALAFALANRSFVLAMQGSFRAAAELGTRADELTSGPAALSVRPYALIQRGGATALTGDPAGDRWTEEGIALAQRVPRYQFVPLGCAWRSMSALRHGRPDEVERWTTFGIGLADEHQIEVGVTTLRMLRHELQLRRGQLHDAEAGLRDLATDPQVTAWGQTVACTLLGRLLARRGDEAEAFVLLDRGWQLARRSDEPERLGRAGAAWFEWAWLYDDDRARAWGDEALAALAGTDPNPWLLGEVLRTRAELEDAGPPPVDLAAGVDLVDPWATSLRGELREAADAWAALGWPVEQARDLAATGDVDAMVDALAIVDRLGATRVGWQLRRRLRERGLQRIPRGPAPSTVANPAGLTSRQLEVLQLLARGLTNAQIAEELVLSPRTVDHHVSAVLVKLGVSSRLAVGEAAARLGIALPAGR
jgi:DNA-binding CsgD family transcriptional regulator